MSPGEGGSAHSGVLMTMGCATSSDQVRTPPIPLRTNDVLSTIDAAPLADAQRHDLDRGHIVVDGHVLVVGMHHRGRARPEDHGWSIGVTIEKARIRRALPTAD